MSGERRQPVSIGQDRVMVSHVVSATMFYAQRVADLQQLLAISESLLSTCPCATALTNKPERETIYGTQFTEDMQWYRCEVMSDKHNENRSRVRFVDYGNEEEKAWSELVELPKPLSAQRRIAQCYVLFGVTPKFERGTPGHEQGLEELKRLIYFQQCDVEIYPKLNTKLNTRNYIPVFLRTNENVIVNDAIISAGFAEKYVFGSKTNQISGVRQNDASGQGSAGGKPFQQQMMQRQQHQQAGNQSLKERLDKARPRPNVNAQHTYPTPSSNAQVSASQNVMEALKANGKPPHMPNGGGAGDVTNALVQRIQTLEADNRELRAAMASQQASMTSQRAAEQETEVLMLTVAELRGKLVNMEKEVAKATQEKEDSNINYLIEELVKTIQKVRQLRIQFPTEPGSKDGIQEAIAMVTGSGRIEGEELEVTRAVHEMSGVYKTAQDAIRQCNQQAVLCELIMGRDEARKQLNVAIQYFTSTVTQLPLQQRCTELRDMIAKLSDNYTPYLNMKAESTLKLEDISEKYDTWRQSSLAAFQEVRTCTNTAHNAVHSQLERLRQNLAVWGACAEDALMAPRVDEKLRDLLSAATSEVQQADVESKEDAQFVADTLHALLTAMETELNNIEHLRALQQQYTRTQEEIRDWLDKSPDLGQIKAVRTTIKGFKSQLRHALADLSDIEDSEDQDEAELSALSRRISDVRTQLHAALDKESELLGSLAAVAQTHFPELLQVAAELGLTTELQYGGLVKCARNMDQYDVISRCAAGGAVVSRFNTRPVIIKEFLIGANIGVDKEEYLKRAMAYHAVKHQNLLKLEAVFFQKGEQHAYLQLPQYPHNLLEYVTSNAPLSKQVVYHLFGGVARGIQALHDAGLAHAAIHPHNVLVSESGDAILAEYDFSHNEKKRLQQQPKCINGLRFRAPEYDSQMSGQTDSQTAGDLYCVGLLVLWMHHPAHGFTLDNHGQPEYDHLPLPTPTQPILQNLLTLNPDRRYTADALLDLPYFRDPPFRSVTSPDPETLQLQRKSSPSPPYIEGSGILKTSPRQEEKDLANQRASPIPINDLRDSPKTIETINEIFAANSSTTADSVPQIEPKTNSPGKTEIPADSQIINGDIQETNNSDLQGNVTPQKCSCDHQSRVSPPPEQNAP